MDPSQIPLRDLHLPDPVGWWPLAPGWWLLLGLLLAGVAVIAWRALGRWRRGRARRHALRAVDRVEAAFLSDGDAVAAAGRLSALLRRAMLAYAPRDEIAGLAGDEWLGWLDRDLSLPQFRNGAGRRLLDLPYRGDAGETTGAEMAGLLAAVRHRLQTPVGGVG